MTFRNPLFTQLIIYISAKLIIMLFLSILIYLLREMLHAKSPEYRYRIKYFYLNWVLIFIYVIGYFGLMIWLRIKYINKDIDLKVYYHNVKAYYYNSNIFDFVNNFIIVLLIIIFIIYLFATVHKFFIIQLTKRFLILHVRATYDLHINFHKYLLLFTIQYYIESLVEKILNVLLCRIYIKQNIENYIYRIVRFIIKHVIRTFPTIVIYIYLFNNILYNDLIISSGFFKYLLFYFIYFTYKRIHFFIDNADLTLDSIIYRMYYLEKSCYYVNIPKEYQNVISRYLDLGLSRDMHKYPEPLLDEVLGSYSLFMASECCFYSKDGVYYTNGRYDFTEEGNKRKDIIIDYSFLKDLLSQIKDHISFIIFCFILFLCLSLLEIIILLIIKLR